MVSLKRQSYNWKPPFKAGIDRKSLIRVERVIE
jgi:hypothetical protein